MRIIKRRERIENVHYGLSFERKSTPGGGFMFDCDQEGNLLKSVLPSALINYQYCLDHPEEFQPKEVLTFRNSYYEPAIGECNDCKREVALHGFTNTCECGIDYNMSGQQLASRSQWGEETGESLSDILSIH